MKKVLMISYRFPPIAGGGVFRTLKFVKYLPSFGWQPILLSAKKSKLAPRDKTLIEEIPDATRVYRTSTIESKIYAWGPSFIGINPKWYHVPDAFLSWLPFALLKAKEVVRKEKPNVIYSTSPPVTSHLIAMLLKEKTGLPWVADFRDPWTQHFGISYPTKVHRDIEEYLEHKVAEYADKIILNTEPNRIDFLRKYLDISPEKCITITNGYDPDDFTNVEIKKENNFTIIYTGSFFGTYNPKKFLEALEELIMKKPEIREKNRLVITGRIDRLTHNLIESSIIKNIIDFKGYVSYRKSIELMVNASVLLLILPPYPAREVKRWIPLKLFNYIATGKPILGILPNGAAAELIRSTNTGVIVSPEDKESIKKIIYLLYQKWEQKNLKISPNLKIIRNFNRKKLTEKLAKIFDKII